VENLRQFESGDDIALEGKMSSGLLRVLQSETGKPKRFMRGAKLLMYVALVVISSLSCPPMSAKVHNRSALFG
jgi:hypothetical protein